MLNRSDDSWKCAPLLVLHQIPTWAYLESSGFPTGAAVCRERLLAICCGDGQRSRDRGGFY